MKESGKNQEIDNLIVEEMRAAFGYGQDQLIAEFDEAARQMDDSEKTPPEGEFEKIISKVKVLEEETKKSSKKVVRLKRVGKIGLLVAVLGCVLLGTGIGVSGKRGYEYKVRTINQGNNDVWNNTNNLQSEYEIEEAYQEMKAKLGIDVLKLFYVPEGMELTEISYGEGYARMNFLKEENSFYFIQSLYPVENSSSITSDRKVLKRILNRGLNKSLEIKENILPDNKIEFSSQFAIDKTYYYLAGVVKEEDFELILKKINYND